MTEPAWPDRGIYVRDQCTCVYCGFQARDLLSYRQLVIDHLIPRSKGGSDAPENKVVAWNYCNRMKAGYDPSDGQWVLLVSEESRRILIRKAKDFIEWAIAKDYGAPGKEQKDFQAMMEELQEKRSD